MKTSALLLVASLLVACGGSPDGAAGAIPSDLSSGRSGGAAGSPADDGDAGGSLAGTAGPGGKAAAAGSVGVAGGGSGSPGGGAGGEGGGPAGGQGGAAGQAGKGGGKTVGCVPGTVVGCEDEFVRTMCDGFGKMFVASCPAEAPFCSMGDCVQCRADSECEQPAGGCYRAACVAGACTKKPREAGAPCEGGVCLEGGVCGACTPGAKRCSDEGEPQVCSGGGQWKTTALGLCGGDKPACSDGGCGGVEQMALGGAHTCALVEGGDVYCWGSNEFGQVGDGTIGGSASAPRRVKALSGIKEISAGYDHTCALSTGGVVHCWGRNQHYQLGGAGAQLEAPSPVKIKGKLFTQVAAGGDHTCGLAIGGRVECWGRNMNLESGVPKGGSVAEPSEVGGLIEVSQISLGEGHSCALKGGEVFCWGASLNPAFLPSHIPTKVAGLSGVETLSAGSFIQAAAFPAAEGVFSFWVWGDATGGQVDMQALKFIPSPVLKTYEGSPSPVAVAVGHGTLGMLFSDGVLRLQGFNGDGRLGQNKQKTALIDWTLPGLEGFAMGDGHTCAWQAGGKAWCWGVNDRGQVGVGSSKEQQEFPFEIAW